MLRTELWQSIEIIAVALEVDSDKKGLLYENKGEI